uniref:Phosphoinositide phospholipase C n=1 Tax=Strongyloides papillosus TaxID=174720 RepID=A0A0N5C908_STREA
MTTRQNSNHSTAGSLSTERRGTASQNSVGSTYSRFNRQPDLDVDKIFKAMENGHKVCRLSLLKKWEPAYKKLHLCTASRQIFLSKIDDGFNNRGTKPRVFDLRHVKEVHSLHYKLNVVKINDKWAKDKDIKPFGPQKILIISMAQTFNMSHLIFLFETVEACTLWSQGIQYIMSEYSSVSHAMTIHRYLKKQFFGLMNPTTECVTLKNMKPFVQSTLQLKIQSKDLMEYVEQKMDFCLFSEAYKKLIHIQELFSERFSHLSDDGGMTVSFNNILRFLRDTQKDSMGHDRERTSQYFTRYWRDLCNRQNCSDPSFTVPEFIDYLFSPENSILDTSNEEIVHDMSRPLSHYWIASSHNTYLTGDQLKSESSLDAYAMALLMGCRCVELDCWDGQKKPNGEFSEIVIYHGYTMTSKLNLRDVLFTIKHYAFVASDYPVILSIEDNCSVPAQRLLAQEIKEILGDMLLTQPVNKDEIQLPSPESMKKKIILKHKKLPKDSDSFDLQQSEDDTDHDILSRECVRKGELLLKDSGSNTWNKHVFVLFNDKLCYMLSPNNKSDDLISLSSVSGDDDISDDNNMALDVRLDEMHVTEEWFHGKIDKDEAASRLMEHADKGNGVFLVRDSFLLIGEYSLSFLYNGIVRHCRIRSKLVDGEKKYFFIEDKIVDTLYELISIYTTEKLYTPTFKVNLVTPCPQPQPHLNQYWFSETVDKLRAEELLGTIKSDGAFLIRYSGTDPNVFVLSLRVDGQFWHYRLKRDGRIFVVNQMIFENLNQLVEFYSTRDFVRGVSLKFPVNEKNIGAYVNKTNNNTPGCYMELKDLEKEIEVVSLKAYMGIHQDELTFPAGAIIKVVRKENNLWRGKYNNNIGWFPSDCVQELENNENVEKLNYGTIELAGCEIIEIDGIDKEFAFKVTQGDNHLSSDNFVIAAETKEELKEWLYDIENVAKSARTRIQTIRSKEKHLRIAAELSDLVVYCQAVPFNVNFQTKINFYEMCSFSEAKHEKLIDKGLIQFNAKQLSRVYPQASRLTSTNLNPVPMWNTACHMVALNYQTGDKSMMLNQGKFLANGRCGYVLKPSYLLDESFRPDQADAVSTSCPVILIITIIGGRHLTRKDKSKGICSPFVDIEIIGVPCDNIQYSTRTITSNGLNPIWNETFEFKIYCPELALLRFLVEDGDFVGPKADPFIGQAVFPVDCLRVGYRSIPLLNNYSEKLELSSLLVHVEMRHLGSNIEISNIFSTLQGNRLQKSSRHHQNDNQIFLTQSELAIKSNMSRSRKVSTSSVNLQPSYHQQQQNFSSPRKLSQLFSTTLNSCQNSISSPSSSDHYQYHSTSPHTRLLSESYRSDSLISTETISSLNTNASSNSFMPRKISSSTIKKLFKFGKQ